MLLSYKKEIIDNYLQYDNKQYQHFLNWVSNVVFISKEKGKMRFKPASWYKSQILMAYYTFECLSTPDIRTIVVLKPRQVGGTEFFKALDLYIPMKFKNTKGAIVAQDEETIVKLRTEITKEAYAHLPPNSKRPILQNNTLFTSFLFDNKPSSFLYYYHPKTRNKKSGNMGRGQSTTYAHLTEVAYYPNVDDLNNFEATFSQSNENRLYIYESTANGYNHFYDLWEAAKESNTKAALFIGWWLKDTYVITNQKDLISYGYDPDSDEQERIDLVKKLYDYDITIEQLAWWRKKLKEEIKESTETNKTKLDQMLEMYPFTEYDAFRATGKQYFMPSVIKQMEGTLKSPEITYEPLFYDKPELTKIVESRFGKIKVWEKEPDKFYRGYILSFDPAYSTNPDSDNSVIQVWKTFKDRLVQVAEFASPTVDTIKSAWLFLKIGSMFNCELNIYEIDGAGKAVAQIIELLRRTIIDKGVSGDADIFNYARRMKQYIYKRIDSLGSGSALQWITGNNKEKIMSQIKQVFNDGMLEINSPELLNELNWIIRDGGNIGAIRGKHDDRVLAAAFAVEAWITNLAHRLPTFEEYEKAKKEQKDIKKMMDEQPRKLFAENILNDIKRYL